MLKVDQIKGKLVDAISEAIKTRGMTYQSIGSLIGVHQGRVSNLVNGRIDLFSLENLIRICNKLGVEVSIRTEFVPPARTYSGKPLKVK